jgi:hypothetical protein
LETVGGEEDEEGQEGGEEEFPPRGVFGFIHANDGGCEDKDELDAKEWKKKTLRSSPSLDAMDFRMSEWRCFQTRHF